MMVGDGREDGFILVEAIVAFLILALALGVAVEAIGQATTALRRAGSIAAESLAAEEALAQRAGQIAEAGTWTGVNANGTSWRMAARRIRDGARQPLFAVTVDVVPPGGGPAVRFRSFVPGKPPK